MENNELAEIIKLRESSLEELKSKYQKLFGKEPTSNNKVFLWRKIAHRLQEQEHGTLSAVADNRIQTLIQQFDPINNKALRPVSGKGTPGKRRDMRLPIPGTVINKGYKGQTLEVRVLDDGFEYKGKTYKSLTAIAKEVTGAHWNGFLFFNL